jgi:hypothetical protein
MPSLTVYSPPNNLRVQPNQPFLVSGQASDRGPPEPALIDSITVQVDNGPVIKAQLTHIPGKTTTLYSFKAFAQVAGGQDPHTVTITATNDSNISVKQTRQVFTGPIFQVDAPAIVIDLLYPFPLDPNDPDPKTAAAVKKMVSDIQNGLQSLSASLASIGKIVAGPNLMNATDPLGRTVTRLGIWIEDAGFPVVPPAPPDLPLPHLLPVAATAGFALVPVQLAPDLDPGNLSSILPGPSFALLIPVGTLQHLLAAVAPTVQAAASQNSVTVDTITAQTAAPGSVTTSFAGHLPANLGFTVTITETLGLVPLANANPSEKVPAVIGNSHSASLGSLLDWFVGFVLPLFGLALGAAFGVLSYAAGKISGMVNGLAGPLVAGIPPRLPFSNQEIPPIPLSVPDFPVLIPNWSTFGATSGGIVGTGSSVIAPRDQSMVAVTVSGSSSIQGYQEDLAGGAGQTYTYALTNLAPDADKFTWHVSGPGTASSGGAITIGPFDQGGSFSARFPLPLHVAPGTYNFTLTVTATETCGSDSSKTLHASASMAVRVDVKANPKLPP